MARWETEEAATTGAGEGIRWRVAGSEGLTELTMRSLAGATMGQVCFTAISSHRAPPPTAFTALSLVSVPDHVSPLVRVFNGWRGDEG